MNEELISEPVANTPDMPAMALRGLTIFPGMTVHFDVGREASIRALNVAMEDGDTIFLVTQRDLSVEEPEQKDLYGMGTIVAVRPLLRLPGDTVRIMVEGLSRARLVELRETKPYLIAAVEKIPNVTLSGTLRSEAVLRQTYELFEHYAELSPKMAPEVVLTVISSRDPAYLADFIAQNIAIRTEDTQSILDEVRPLRRLEKLNAILKREGEVLELKHDLDDKMQEHMNQGQKE
ncbi:MAG: LON peptidase substrate-binding domain-containing protein, partial [Clostridiales bacterium]|nr:LON peptidase substrate-binding domain-containing protein [Clostridiales bacterium]